VSFHNPTDENKPQTRAAAAKQTLLCIQVMKIFFRRDLNAISAKWNGNKKLFSEKALQKLLCLMYVFTNSLSDKRG